MKSALLKHLMVVDVQIPAREPQMIEKDKQKLKDDRIHSAKTLALLETWSMIKLTVEQPSNHQQKRMYALAQTREMLAKIKAINTEFAS